MWTYPVPNDIFDKVLGGFVADTAQFVLRDHGPGKILHPGDPYGQVLAWLWHHDADASMSMVADLPAQLRYHAPGSDKSIRLDDLLDGLTFALHDMPSNDAKTLIGQARAKVPAYFEDDVNS